MLMLGAGRNQLVRVLLLLPVLLSSCYTGSQQKPTGLAGIVKQIIFNQYCHSEDDRATEVGIKLQEIPDTITFVLLPPSAARSLRVQTGIESDIKRGLAQHAFDTTSLKNYKISYANAPLLAHAFTFHLCNGELYAHVMPIRQRVALPTTTATLVLSTPVNLTRNLQLLYYRFDLDQSGSDGFVVIRNLNSTFPEVLLNQTMNIYN